MELAFNNEQIKIRDATQEDHSAIIRITQEVFAESTFEKNIENHYGIIGDKDWIWRKTRHLQEDLSHPDGHCLVAASDKRVLGYVTIRLDKQAKIGVIANLAVTQVAANKGIGRALLKQAEALMRDVGMEVARIETLEQNMIGQHLYPQLGFDEIARQIYFAMDLREQNENR
ncbi:MAG: hypothetical protein CMJ76_11475 [Planctomycetaceae bacterium]|nr:hypothetical protein [Planctomycetaceae bacterium]|tara:strand:- start:324 stop:839 length:516 start_codon:yes stop_codon:yes gene_type:complete